MSRSAARIRSVRRRHATALGLALLVVTLPSAGLLAMFAAQATADIAGEVFQDFNANGVKDAGGQGVATDVPVEGILVRAFDATGALLGSTSTVADGSYTIPTSLSAGSPVRVEFEIPTDDPALAGLEPSFAALPGATGITAGTSVQFATAGSTGVNFAVQRPGEYCQDNPDLVTCLMLPGDAAGLTAPGPFVVPTTSLVSENMVDGADSALPWTTVTRKGTADAIGSVFGIGVDRSGTATTAPNAYLGTYVKRHVEYGFAGATNTIYRLTLPEEGLGDASVFITLPGTLPAHDPTGVPGQLSTIPYSGDVGVFEHVGRVGLGDVDVTPDGRTLLAVDMDETAPKLWFVPILGSGSNVEAGTPVSVPIPRPATFNDVACPGTWHPMGIGTRGDRILVGGVCGAEDTVTPSTPRGVSPTATTAFVLEWSGSSFSTIFAMSLDYPRGCAIQENCISGPGTQAGEQMTAMWGAWNEYPAWVQYTPTLMKASNPQAMLSNIEIADNGDLVLNFRDRFADQSKSNLAAYSKAYETGSTFAQPPLAYGALADTFSVGDILRVCNAGGTLTLEADGTCAGSSIAGSDFTDVSGRKEFYYDNYPHLNFGQYHPETANGSSASMPGYAGVWITGWDMSSVNQQAIISFGDCADRFGSGPCYPASNTTGYGSRIGGVSLLTSGSGLSWGQNPSFDKGNGLADLEVVCDQAPMQIGNRVWIDLNGDGIQDPGEPVIAGATVRLYDSSGTLVGTAVTDADGQYLFSSLVVEPSDGGASPDSVGGGLLAGESYTIRLDESADYAQGGPLAPYYPTVADATASDPSAMSDAVDSDGTLVGTGTYGVDLFPTIMVSAMEPGVNDHTFDFGFIPLVAVGDKVWVDNNGNGIQDPSEGPIPGTVVSLYLPDGTPATRADGSPATTVSLADGTWVIDRLFPGDYYAVFELPQGFTFTTALAGTDTGADSNADPVTGITGVFTLTADTTGNMEVAPGGVDAAFIDPTIDAGAVPNVPVVVGVGDRVWIDLDRDGLQGPGEPPLEGVTVTLFEADGVTPVLRIDGRPATAVSDADGHWFIDMLVPGDYVARFALPQGYEFTRALEGEDTGSDSNVDPLTGTAAFTIAGSATGDTTADTNPLTTATFSNLTIDVGVVSIPPILVGMGDRVWLDTDLDGIQGAGEQPVAGVLVTLYEADGVTLATRFDGSPATAVTDADGRYFIDGLVPGDYRALFTNLPAGYGFTTASAGTDPTTDANPDPSTGITPVFTIAASATGTTIADDGSNLFADFVNLTIDAGIVPLVAVGDIVWFDFINSQNAGSNSLNWTQHDARYSGTEPGVPGVLVELFEADGITPVMKSDGSGEPATAITDENGRYVIDGLAPGTYRAKFHLPDGYSFLMSPGNVASDVNSDPDQATGLTPAFTLSAEQTGAMQPNTDPSVNALFIDRTVDAGVLPALGYGGTLWVDLNGDGIRDPDEPPLAGVTLTIASWYGPVLDVNGDPVTATTGPDGRYVFEGLPHGIAGPNWLDIHGYEILIQVPDGYVMTATGSGLSGTNYQTEGISHFTSTGGSSAWRFLDVLSSFEYLRPNDDPSVNAMYYDPNVDGGLIPHVSVGDYVWFDVNGDGLQDATDLPMEGVTLTITKADGSPVLDVFGNPVTTTTTDADGRYSFDLLPLGQYTVTVTAPEGYEPTVAGAGADSALDSSTGSATSVVLTSGGQRDATLDFGFVKQLVAVGDFVWIDLDGDGLQGADEPPLRGVLVELFLADGETPALRADGSAATATTDADGFYVIDGLLPGDYRARFTLQCACGFTVTTSGSPGDDSDADPDTGMTEVFTLSLAVVDNMEPNADPTIRASFIDPTIDAGVVPKPSVSVGDYVWFDVNGDGLQDDTDVPLAGVTLTITNLDGSAVTDVYGNSVTTTTTDADGRYSFDFLPFGQYVVTVTVPAGYLPTIAGAGEDAGADSSDGSATSVELTTDGQRDPTLDFGFVIDPSVEDSSDPSEDGEGDGDGDGDGEGDGAGDRAGDGTDGGTGDGAPDSTGGGGSTLASDEQESGPVPAGIPAGAGRGPEPSELLALIALIAAFLRTVERRSQRAASRGMLSLN
jgi:protocatechuate 3,4-dioxygenase beta subunit